MDQLARLRGSSNTMSATAKALDLTVPLSILLRADEIIE
jgi:hypothetical protein